MANGSADQGTNGDEVMQKDEKTISKFSKEALKIGAAVCQRGISGKSQEVVRPQQGR